MHADALTVEAGWRAAKDYDWLTVRCAPLGWPRRARRGLKLDARMDWTTLCAHFLVASPNIKRHPFEASARLALNTDALHTRLAHDNVAK